MWGMRSQTEKLGVYLQKEYETPVLPLPIVRVHAWYVCMHSPTTCIHTYVHTYVHMYVPAYTADSSSYGTQPTRK